MKFIHTADWHLGNSLFKIDRTQEFDQFLAWLKDTIVEKEPDALVISGDVFDIANPPVNARKQYNAFLASLLTTKCRNVFIVGGNHDSGALLDSEKEILDVLNIHVVGSVNNLEPEDMVFEIKDENGEVIGICGAVPFAREIELRKYYEEEVEPGKLSDCSYEKLYNLIKEAAENKKNGKKVPVIATGHLYASGLEGRFEGCEKEPKCDDGRRSIDDVIGNLGSVHVSVFPEDFSYVALGHIHYTSMVAKNPTIRYSGSPFILGFDEADLPRHVLLVETNEGEETKVEKIQVPRFFDFKRLKGTIDEIVEKLETYKNVPVELPTFLELYYKREDGVNANDVFYEAAMNLPENVHVVNKKAQDERQTENYLLGDLDIDEMKNLEPEDIFRSLILSKSSINTEGMSEEEKKQKEDELVNKYLPLFMEVAKEVEDRSE